jgi:hypothetical protein
MWREPDEIKADLQSQEAGRVADGLRDLEECMDQGADEFPLAPLDIGVLRPFADQLPEDVQLRMLRILDGYQSFDPAQTDREKYGKIAVLGSRWGNYKMALEAALVVKRASDPAQATLQAMETVRADIDSALALQGTQYFVSLLLDGAPPVRRATIEALATWPKHPPFSEVVEYIVPQLEPDEVALLGR